MHKLAILATFATLILSAHSATPPPQTTINLADTDVLKIEAGVPPAAQNQNVQKIAQSSQEFWLSIYDSIGKLGDTVLKPQDYIYQPMSQTEIRKYYPVAPIVTKIEPEVETITVFINPNNAAPLPTKASDKIDAEYPNNDDKKPNDTKIQPQPQSQPQEQPEKDFVISVSIGQDGTVSTNLEIKPRAAVEQPQQVKPLNAEQLVALIEKLRKETEAKQKQPKAADSKPVQAPKDSVKVDQKPIQYPTKPASQQKKQ